MSNFLNATRKIYSTVNSIFSVKWGQYLVDGARSLIVVNMTIESYIDLILLPEFLKALSPHWFLEGSLDAIEFCRWITNDPMCEEDEPWLFLSVGWRQAVLNESILLRPRSPILLSVRYAEAEHTIISWIPGHCEVYDECSD